MKATRVATRTISLPNRIRSERSKPRGALRERVTPDNSRAYIAYPLIVVGVNIVATIDLVGPTFTTANGVPVNNDATPML